MLKHTYLHPRFSLDLSLMLPAESYALQMMPQGQGHPLYDPYPGRHISDRSGEFVRKPRVEIGDVGYVSP